MKTMGGLPLIKKFFIALLLTTILLNTCSCGLLRKPLDNRSGFSKHLKQTENYIRNEDWGNAKSSLEYSEKTWKQIKPILQVDIDHDYVNDIEKDFIKLEGYIDTKEKPDSLTSILLIQDTWKNIGSL